MPRDRLQSRAVGGIVTEKDRHAAGERRLIEERENRGTLVGRDRRDLEDPASGEDLVARSQAAGDAVGAATRQGGERRIVPEVQGQGAALVLEE